MELQDEVLYDPRDLDGGFEISDVEEAGITSSSHDSDDSNSEKSNDSLNDIKSKRAKFSKKHNLEKIEKDKEAKSVPFSSMVTVAGPTSRFSKKPRLERLKDHGKREVPSYAEHMRSQQSKGRGGKSGNGLG